MRFLCFLLLLSFQIGFGQAVSLKNSTPLIADRFIGIDNYKNTYFLKDRVLHKQGEDGDFIYNALQLGRIFSVDIINPLKVVVFFQDTNTVVFLDNKLSEIERISFNNLSQFLNVSTATTASSNSLWIFNIDTQQLEVYNFKTNMQTVVSQPFPGKLVSQASNFNYCFVLTQNKLLAFNVYGSLLNEVNSEGYEKIVQQNENIIAVKENSLYYIPDFAKHRDEILREPIKLELPEITIKDLELSNDFLYIYDGKNLHTFTLTLPKK